MTRAFHGRGASGITASVRNRRKALTGNLPRRLKQLETRAKVVAAARPEPHTICFVTVDKKVAGTYGMGTGKWMHFDPPRDRAEFEPMV